MGAVQHRAAAAGAASAAGLFTPARPQEGPPATGPAPYRIRDPSPHGPAAPQTFPGLSPLDTADHVTAGPALRGQSAFGRHGEPLRGSPGLHPGTDRSSPAAG